MGVYIPGMETPTSCCDCPLFKSNNSGQLFCRGKRVAFGKEDAEWLPKTTPNWCPLIPVPDHGRLIDADAAVANRNDYTNWCYDLYDLPDYLADCPTIIPADHFRDATKMMAEEGEG